MRSGFLHYQLHAEKRAVAAFLAGVVRRKRMREMTHIALVQYHGTLQQTAFAAWTCLCVSASIMWGTTLFSAIRCVCTDQQPTPVESELRLSEVGGTTSSGSKGRSCGRADG